jgi:hypothetical protein
MKTCGRASLLAAIERAPVAVGQEAGLDGAASERDVSSPHAIKHEFLVHPWPSQNTRVTELNLDFRVLALNMTFAMSWSTWKQLRVFFYIYRK